LSEATLDSSVAGLTTDGEELGKWLSERKRDKLRQEINNPNITFCHNWKGPGESLFLRAVEKRVKRGRRRANFRGEKAEYSVKAT